ncbi:MAG TPA: hypothetical protein PK852_02565 [Mesotoga prima]|nr:hypothetical protein [Mesotoga prima]
MGARDYVSRPHLFLSQPKRKKKDVKKFLIASAIVAAGMTVAPVTASAAPIGEGCVSDFWMWQGLRTASRMICDGDRAADGSWERRRGFFDDPYYVPFRCSRYSCWGGYWVPELKVMESYRVTDDTVLPDEPGWIPSAEPRIVN